MFQFAFVRFLTASLLLSAYGMTDALTRLFGGKPRPARVPRPLWSHLAGFASMILFYGAIGTDGRAVLEGHGNDLGVALAILAIVLRVVTHRRGGSVRYPDLATRVLFFAALPLVVGSASSLLVLTLPQAAIAAYEARQRDAVRDATIVPGKS